MSTYPLLAETTWLRLALVGADILAVAAVVRLWAVVVAWRRTPRPRLAPAVVPARRRGPPRT